MSETLPIKWSSEEDYPPLAAPLLMTGDRVVGFADRSVFAVNIFSGRQIDASEQEGGLPYPVRGRHGSPHLAYGNGAIYFMDGHKLMAVQLADGKPIEDWQPQTIRQVSSLARFNDVIVAVNRAKRGGTQVSAYHMADGQKAWGPLKIADFSPGEIGLGEDAIFFVTRGQLTAVNIHFGDKRFPRPPKPGTAQPSYDLNQSPAPLIGENVVVAVGRKVHGFDIITGEEKWAFPAGSTSGEEKWHAAFSEDKTRVVAVSSHGEVASLDTESGTPYWQQQIPPEETGQPTIAGGKIYITAADQSHMQVFDLASGTAEAVYNTDENINEVGPAIGNGMLFIPSDSGNILAKPYGSQNAAYFNGDDARIDVLADDAQFDFGTGDFTIEAWVRSSAGGEIVSSCPTEIDLSNHGFRFNLSRDGELRFAVTNLAQTNQDLAKSRPTNAADGFWHHVAVVRREGAMSFFVDGHSSEPATLHKRDREEMFANGQPLMKGKPVLNRLTLTPERAPSPLDITGDNALTIGAYRQRSPGDAKDHFTGLLREVRIWKTAVDVAKIQSRMNIVIGPLGPQDPDTKSKATDPHLIGNWHLDQDNLESAVIENDVLHHEFTATPRNLVAIITDLTLDMSAFPYLLENAQPQWPYGEHWAARGEHSIQTPAVLNELHGVICFGTNNDLYAVDKHDGKRKWGIGTPYGASTPVADGELFYAFTGDRSLIEIDAESGECKQVPAFATLEQSVADEGSRLSAPAMNPSHLAAAAPDGSLWVCNRSGAAADQVLRLETEQNPGSLQMADDRVYCVAGREGARQLFIYGTDGHRHNPIAVDSDIFCVQGKWLLCIQDQKLVVIDVTQSLDATTQANSVDGSQITGLAASTEQNLLAVATDDGEVYGLGLANLGLRWKKALPRNPAGPSGVVNQPVIVGRNVYCTSRSGTVAVLDGAKHGELRGRYFAANPVATPALVDRGTVFFGCDDAGPTDALDGALHSLVFGETYALRLDPAADGIPGTSDGYAVVRFPDEKKALHLMDVEQCCVEGWVNTNSQSGGEIVSICPSRDGRFGLRLFLASDGKVHFVSHDNKFGDQWEGLHAETVQSIPVCDGRWHHIAVSCKGKNENGEWDVRMYVDGVSQDVACQGDDGTPANIASGLVAYLGADATQADSTPANFFNGMIGEVRVWDTYLVAEEISERMHVKLRGNEPDLLAYWNFDTVGIHDGSRYGHDGALHPNKGDATFWLTDLTFEQPLYPYLTTQASITQEGEGGDDASSRFDKTEYDLVVSAHKADGSPLPDAELELWYVKHPDEDEPDEISLSGKSITAVEPAHEQPSSHSFKVVTNGRGKAHIKVATSKLDHGPSLDLRAAFMPANERFHISVLVDNQRLAKPSPPTLVVQSKLIQDYHYSPGSKIDSTRSRATYRTMITAQNADQSPRFGERIRLLSECPMEVEVKGKKYKINDHNSQEFRTDENGQLTVVMAAGEDSLKMPELHAWAGFMHRGELLTIHVDEGTHAALTDVQGHQMADPERMSNWKPESEGGPERGSLLNKDYSPHADKIASSVRSVAAAASPKAKPPPGRLTPVAQAEAALEPAADGLVAARAPSAAHIEERSFNDMRQPMPTPRGDQTRTLHTLRHIKRKAPITPEAMAASLDEEAPGSVGFVFGEDDEGKLHIRHFTAAEAAEHMGASTGQIEYQLAGWFGSDIWHAVEHTAESAWEGIKKVAVAVADTVSVAIHYVEDQVVKIATMVVNSIAEAVAVIGEFLKKIALAIVDIIKFLMFLFDWDAIIATHKIIIGMVHASFQKADELLRDGHAVRQAIAPLKEIFNSVVDALEGKEIPEHSLTDMQSAQSHHPGTKHVHSVAGNSMYSKAKDNPPRDYPKAAAVGTGGVAAAYHDSDFGDFLERILELVPQVVTLSFSELVENLLEIVRAVVDMVLDGITEILATLCDLLAKGLQAALELFDHDIDIPFISMLYKWVTGDDLSLLSLFALILAVPVNIAYYAISGGRHFNDDAERLPEMMARPLPQLSASRSAATHEADDPVLAFSALPTDDRLHESADLIYVVSQGIYMLATVGSDSTYVTGSSVRPLFKIIRGVTGLISVNTQRWWIEADFQKNLQADMDPKEQDWLADLGHSEAYLDTKYGIATLAAAWPLGTGLYGLGKSAASPTPAPATDRYEYAVALFGSMASIVLILTDIHMVSSNDSLIKDHGLRDKWRYFKLRDMFIAAARFPGFLFTYPGYVQVPDKEDTYGGVTIFRGVVNTAGIGFHALGAWG